MNANELTERVVALTERLESTKTLLDSTNKNLDELRADHKRLQQEHNDHRRETERENAVRRQEIEKLKKSKDLWGNRAFTLFMCLVSAVIGGIITYFVKKP